MEFERVYMILLFYDGGSREGIADFEGRPHFYESEWDEDSDLDTFQLSPISPEVLALALEDWAIWERWQAAFEAGRAGIDSHPALPDDRARHLELNAALEGRLRIDPNQFVRARGEFREVAEGAEMEVRWAQLAGR